MSDVTASALRAQYGAGFINNRQVPGYLQEKGVKPDSTTETYAALTLHVNSPRWDGVPFTLRSGKALPEELSPNLCRPAYLASAAGSSAPP